MSNYCRFSTCNGNLSNNDVLSGNTNRLVTCTNNANSNNNANTNDCNCTNDNLLDSLCNCIGRRCTCEFDTNDGLESKSGILERIGNDYFLLRSLNNNRLMYCRVCSLLFITINN